MPATFAIYAVGCLQIPLVDMIMTSTGQRDDGQDGGGCVAWCRDGALWHETILATRVPDGAVVRSSCSSSRAT
jgi:hypothetical protein